MTKANVIDEIVEKTGMAKRDVSVVVEAFMQVVRDNMADKQENVYMRGFGSFIVKKRAEKTARNISKNTALIVPEHNIPAFKPAKSFMQRMLGQTVTAED